MNKKIIWGLALLLIISMQGVIAELQVQGDIVDKPIFIHANQDIDLITIQSPSGIYKLLGSQETISFVPKESGVYTITTSNQGTIIDSKEIIIGTNIEIISLGEEITLKDGYDVEINVGEEIYRTYNTSNSSFTTKVSDLHKIRYYLIDSFQFEEKYFVEPKKEIKIDTQTSEGKLVVNTRKDIPKIKSDSKKIIVDSEEITALRVFELEGDYKNAELEIISKGKKIYICQEYSGSCNNGWRLYKTTFVGEKVKLSFNNNTAYAEIGLATINSVKPIYEVNQRAEFLTAVLDTAGYLVSNASVTVQVVDPNGNSYDISDTVVETSMGIYYSYFDATSFEGYYTINVQAIGNGVDSQLSNIFLVDNDYEFDIVRNSPSSIDPFAGTHNTSFVIIAKNTNQTNVTVRESVPDSFEIVRTYSVLENGSFGPNASVVSANGRKILSWKELPLNTTYFYESQAPLITPELHYLGPIYVNNFEEARPWALASDPTLQDSSLTANTSSVWEGNLITVTGNIECIGGGQAINFNFWPEDDNVEIINDDSCTSRDFEWVSTTVNSCVSSDSCTASATTARVDVVKCKNGGSASVTWTLRACGTNEALPSSNTITMNSNIADAFDLSTSVTITEVPDTQSPVVVIGNPVNNTFTNDNTPTFYYTPTDDRGFSSCSLILNGVINESNSTGIINGSLNSITPTLSNGNFIWTVSCTDTSSNTGLDDNRKNITIDTISPTQPSLISPQDLSYINDLTPIFDWSQTTEVNFLNYTLLVDTDPSFASPDKNIAKTDISTTSHNSVVALSNLQKYYWKVVVYDKAQNSIQSDTYEFTTDITPPTSFSLVSPINGIVSADTTPLFDWATTSETYFANYTLQIDESIDFSSPIEYTQSSISTSQFQVVSPLASNQLYYWRVIAYDLAGNIRYSNQNFTYETDNTNPVVTINNPVATFYSSNNISLQYEVSDSNLDSCWYTVNGGANNKIAGCTNTTIIFSSGSNTLRVYANDTAGNVANDVVTFTVDLINPVVLLNDPANTNYVTTKPFEFNYTPTDNNLDTCTLYTNSSGWGIDGSPLAATSGIENSFSRTYNDGYYTWNVMCTDLASRTSFASSNYTFILDTVPPTVNLMSPDEGHTEINSNNLDFKYNVSDTTSSITQCSLYINGVYDQQQNNPAENAELDFLKNLNNGVYTWSVRCTDTAGFTTISESRNLTVTVVNDNDPPVIVLNDPNEGDFVSTSEVFFNYTVSDSTGISQCSIYLDGQLNQSCVSDSCNVTVGSQNNFTISGISDGQHNYAIECYDSSSNFNYAISQTNNFTVDETIPYLTLQSPISATYQTTKDILLSFTTYDTNPLTCYYSINNGANNSINSCLNTTFNSLRGINNFTIYSEDSAKNINSTSVQFTAFTNSSLITWYTPEPAQEIAPYTIYANYSDEFSQPITGAICSAYGDFDKRVMQVGYEESDAFYSSNAIYSSNLLRVDVKNIPIADNYEIYFYGYRQIGTSNNLSVYLRCDGSYTTAPQYLVGQVSTDYALAYPQIGKHKVYVDSSFVTSENCSIIFESSSSTISNNWTIAEINKTLNQYTYYSANDGSSYIPVDNSFVDFGYDFSIVNLTYNSSSGYYELNDIHSDLGGTYQANVSCVADYVYERNETLQINVSVPSVPKIQIVFVSPSPATYLIDDVIVEWAVNSFGLGNNYLNITYPNGSLLNQYSQKEVTILKEVLNIPGNYTAIVYAEHSNDGDFNTTSQNFQVIDYSPKYYNVSVNPQSPQVYNESLVIYFNSTWLDPNNNLVNVYLENNFFGPIVNSSTTNSSNIFFYQNTLPAGSYTYRWIGTDTNNNTNRTQNYFFTINKDNSSLTLRLNGNDNDLVINETQVLNITSTLNVPQTGLVYIYENGSLLGSASSPYTLLKNYTIPGVYNITSRFFSNQNYTATLAEHTLTVNDIIAPNITLISPFEQETDLDGTVNFAYSVQDSGTLNNCSLYINGVFNDSVQSPLKNTVLNFNKELVNGNYNYYIGCYDTANNYGVSQTTNFSVDIRTFIIDLYAVACNDGAPCTVTTINNSDQNYYSHGNLNNGNNYVYVNLSSPNIKAGSTIDYMNVSWEKFQETSLGSLDISWWNGNSWVSICTEIFVNSVAGSPDDVECEFLSYPTIDQINEGLQLRGNFFYSATSGGKAFETDFVGINMQYTEDTTPPSISLSAPSNNQQLGSGNITFEYLPSDVNLDNCTLYGDFSGSFTANETDTSPVNSITNSFTIYLGPGYYTWNVMCIDIAQNQAFSATNRTVNITKPDLQILSNDITFSKNNPVEFEFVNVSAYITNEGLTQAVNFTVEFFYGNPQTNGVQFGSTQLINSLSGNQGITINETYQVKAGPNDIYVRLDLSDNVDESSENNNLAFNTLDVSAYAVYYGNITRDIILVSSSNDALIRFFNITNNTGNVFVSDYDDSINFGSLQALGRNINGQATTNDFDDADILLGIDTFADSLSEVWASGSNTPDKTISINAFGKTINNIPVINNSNTSEFITGILWDSSYDIADLQYSQDDKEPLVFYTRIDSNTQGIYGVYDMEVKVPALLRNYSSGNDLVTFYVEIE